MDRRYTGNISRIQAIRFSLFLTIQGYVSVCPVSRMTAQALGLLPMDGYAAEWKPAMREN